MTVPFLPVFAVVHPPVKQTKPYEVQQCSVLTQASLSGLLFLLAHLPSPPGHRKASVSGYDKVRGKHQPEEPENTADIL